jgi:hypothetical protein
VCAGAAGAGSAQDLLECRPHRGAQPSVLHRSHRSRCARDISAPLSPRDRVQLWWWLCCWSASLLTGRARRAVLSWTEDESTQRLADLFLQFAPFFRMYSQASDRCEDCHRSTALGSRGWTCAVRQQPRGGQPLPGSPPRVTHACALVCRGRLRRWRAHAVCHDSLGLALCVQEATQDPRCKGQNLQAFLITPIQRIPRCVRACRSADATGYAPLARPDAGTSYC